MQSVASQLELDEVVSPELVLVDPELAQIARRRLRSVPEWRPQTPPRVAAPLIAPIRPPIALAGPAAIVHAPVPMRGRPRAGAWASAVPLSLIAALVLAMVVSEVQAALQGPVASLDQTAVASQPPALGPAAAPATRTATPKTSSSTPRPDVLGTPKQLPTTREVEVRTLALLADGSTALPAALRDDRSGRLANNVWLACRRVGSTARFTCKLGAGASSSRRWFLTVAVAKDGREVLTWEPTRMAH
jgi:hypothetical protein